MFRSKKVRPKLIFAPTRDGWKLATYRYQPDRPTSPWGPALLVHGLSANRFDLDAPDPEISVARYLHERGHDVAVYEASDRLGGMLPLAIPEFRLPRKIIEEDIAPILDLRPQVFLNTALGRDTSIEALLRRHDAVLLAVGCQKPYRLGVPGENLSGVVFGLDFLMDVLAGKKVEVGRKALVIGGGYTAVDCARMLVRLGTEEVTMVYRRTAREISIDAEEMHHLEMEDVAVRYLTTVSQFLPGDDGRMRKVELVRTKLDGGRVVPIADSAREEAFDLAVICVGQGALGKDFITKGVGAVFRDERLVVDPETFQSSMPGFFGAGDYVHGTRSIIDAVGDGRRAAWGIHASLTGRELDRTHIRIHAAQHSGRKRSDDFIPRVSEQTSVGKKKPRMALEAALGLNREEGHRESLRCYLCNLHYEINIDDCIFCMRCIDEAPVDCIKQVKKLGAFGEEGPRLYTEAKAWDEIGIIYIDNDRCVRCGKCLDVCPTRCISVTKYALEDPVLGGEV